MTEIGLHKNDLDTPFLWVDLDILEQNIAYLGRYFQAAGVNWRPHTKGIKVPAIAHQAIAAGAIGVTCAKLGEAEIMAAAGIKDILIANQIIGPQKIRRLVNIQGQAAVKVAIDNPTNVKEMGAAAAARGVEIGVLVDVDTGMQRSGVAPGQAAVALSRLVHDTPGLRYLGLMAWEGHAVGLEDPEIKRETIEKAIGLLKETADQCRVADLPIEIVSGGGSGTYTISTHLPCLTEIQAGGVIFSDVSYRQWGVETTPCLFIRSTISSHPRPERLIFDAGFKTLPAWSGRTPEPIGLPNAGPIRTSAEHGTITLSQPNPNITVGDAFDFIPGYTDMTLFLHDQLYGVRDGVVEVVWDIQGRGKLR